MPDIPRSETISTRQQTIATRARQAPELSFTSLNHCIDLDWLVEAYRRTRKDGAPGVDGQTAAAYAEHLEDNLQDLLDRAKSGRYRAPAVKRAYIPKGDGSTTRPIGVPTFEDKLLQRAVVMVLEPIYEQDFVDCSYGFRPGRSAHQALEAWRNQLMSFGGGWVIELDVQRFFDTLDKAQLQTFVRRRVRDGVLLRLIGKWLNAGVLEDGAVWYPEAGTPQGGVASPLLANIFLHEVLDAWFERDIKPRLKGQAVLIRYADDAVLGFSQEEDARRVLAVLPKRFGKYGLTLHPENSTDRFPQAAGTWVERLIGLPEQADLRSAGLHPLLGEVAAWVVGDQAEDGQGSSESGDQPDRTVVPRAPPCASTRATPRARAEAARALRVLRDHRELVRLEWLPARGQATLVLLAQSAI